MYTFGQKLTEDRHFQDHLEHEVPVQVNSETGFADIGFVEGYNELFVRVNGMYYSRYTYVFISRPGY